MKAWLSILLLISVSCELTLQDDVETKTNLLDTLIEQSKNVKSDAIAFRKKVNEHSSTLWKVFWKELQVPYNAQKIIHDEKKKATYEVIKNATDRKDPVWVEELEKIVTKYEPETLEGFKEKLSAFKTFLRKKQQQILTLGAKVDGHWEEIQAIDQWIDSTQKTLTDAATRDADIDQLESQLYLITKQIQSQQFNEEEKTRSDGNSGIKQIRVRYSGAKNYFSNTHTGNSFASIHDHANNINTCGMGEFIGVLNGIEFRTRHNDYALRKPVTNDKTLNKVEAIEFPDVPDSVKDKTTIEEQIAEMREYFRAFKEQDISIRPYKDYFKAVLCYLEGAWVYGKSDVDEPFDSSRHHIDAKTWFELQEKIQFTSYTGTKNLLENLAHLPTKIMGFKDKKPMFAQWNYRIVCHPLKDDLPTNYLTPLPNPAAQRMKQKDMDEFIESRAIRFDLEGVDHRGRKIERPMSYSYLDSLMEQIPGKDNYGANMPAVGLDSEIVSARPGAGNQLLNGAYYHRAYKLKEKDAMGISSAQRSYSDRLYAAMTSQEDIAGPEFTDAKGKEYKAKVSYAIPLEIIYLTPLMSWNPYDIEYDDNWKNVMTGSGTKESPYASSDPRHFYHTPGEFFTGSVQTDSADTSKSEVYVKNRSGEVVKTRASGVRITFPKISGIDGIIRQRYPIMPVHGEGSSIWKRINAFEDSIDFKMDNNVEMKYLTTGVSHPTENSANQATEHTHIIELTKADYDYLLNNKGTRVAYTTTTANTHSHEMKIFANAEGKIEIENCDGTPKKTLGDGTDEQVVCFDNHPITLKVN